MLELRPVNDMSDDELLALITEQNDLYRNTGESEIADELYDEYKTEFEKRQPNHPFNQVVEAESVSFGDNRIRHATPMLSTQKCYTTEELEGWINRQIKGAEEAGVDPTSLKVRITPKLDGMAARQTPDGTISTRGDGLIGNNITKLLNQGLVMIGTGNGEIVCHGPYFEEFLKDSFAHPRGVVVGIAGADNVRPEAQEALQDGAIRFVSYDEVANVEMPLSELTERLMEAQEKLLSTLEYAYDGIVIEITDETVKSYMGHGSHHHNWQVAWKTKGEMAETTVKEILWQVGRTGIVSPVALLETVNLSGANISRATLHNAKNCIDSGIGAGAVVKILRSGEVIPYVAGVVKSVDASKDLPTHCPSCSTELEWCSNSVRLVCNGQMCPAQMAETIEYHFKMLGVDGFGPAACETLVNSGLFDSLASVHFATEQELVKAGISSGIAKNIFADIQRSRTTAIDDFKILASLGIQHLGRGDSKKLLKEFSLETLTSTEITPEQISSINGFGQLTADAISKGLKQNTYLLNTLWSFYKPVVVKTPSREDAANIDSAIAGKHIVFTGKMVDMTREEMQKQAEALGAINQSSVNGKTDILVAGANVGASKMGKAEKLGVKIISEADYIALIS